MLTFRTSYRVIYGDTDNMGIAYYANYLRWFEIGRNEMFRSLGVLYKDIEAKGVFLPVSEAFCKYIASAKYDDLLTIETKLDTAVKAGMKFDYEIFNEQGTLLVKGYTRHAYINADGKVLRPPKFLSEILRAEAER